MVPAFESITGWSRNDWIGRSIVPLLHPLDVPVALDSLQRIVRGGRVPNFELRVAARKGGHVPIEMTITPQVQGERIVGILGIGRDVAERKRLEEQVRQMQKLDSIGQLAAGIAHDFNNILTVQQGYVSLLRANPRGDDSDRTEALRQVAEASERAANLTRQLLLFSRKQVIQPRTLNLNDEIAPMTKMLSRVLGEHISLQFNYASNLPTIDADAGMIEQVLVNLAVNARDAMPSGGSLIISTRLESIENVYARQNPEARAGDFVCLSVADKGCGILPENLSHIFEPFFTTKDVGKGTGLGLATVYGIVKQHRGWIEVESAVGQGTAFKVFLPAGGQVAGTDTTARSEPEVRGGKETILVVEDEPALREMVKRILERFGYKVILAVSGVQALQVWATKGHSIDLLLTDMVMPEGINGRGLAERLHLYKPEMPVIYTSGYSTDVAGDDLVLNEGVNFLQKPFHPKKLAQAVRDALDRSSG